METFYIVCGWDNYYPDAGIGNIKLVTFDENEAKAYVEEKMKLEKYDRCDKFEIYTSDELPWGGSDYVSPDYSGSV